MEDNAKLIENLLERTTEYGKTSYALVKLKALEKASEIVSVLVPFTIALLIIAAILLFLSLGLAFWLGEIWENENLGFFAVALLYAIIGTLLRFIFLQPVKHFVSNFIIRLALN